MRKIYNNLYILLWVFIGVYIGSSIYKYYDYKTHIDLYAMTSAPWYLSIQINAIFTFIIEAVIHMTMWIIKKKMK